MGLGTALRLAFVCYCATHVQKRMFFALLTLLTTNDALFFIPPIRHYVMKTNLSIHDVTYLILGDGEIVQFVFNPKRAATARFIARLGVGREVRVHQRVCRRYPVLRVKGQHLT